MLFRTAVTLGLMGSVFGQPTEPAAAPHPLIAAVEAGFGWNEAPKFLAAVNAHGADSAARDGEGRTPLHLTVARGDDDYAALLMLRGADVNATDALGRTPLMVAADRQRTWSIFALILRGAELNRTNHAGQTVLDIAVAKNDFRHAEILLWAGADPAKVDLDRAPTAEIRAAIEAYQKFADRPTAPAPLPEFVRNPLHKAAATGDYPALESLLSSSSGGPNLRDENGRTALFEAIRAGQAEVVFYLLRVGADPNSLDNESRSALGATMVWLGGGLDAMRRFLLLRGANPSNIRQDGHSELTWAVKRDNEHGVNWLIWSGVDPQQRTRHGTPFELAVAEGNQRIIDLLRRYGIDGPTRLSDDPAWLLLNGSQRGDIAMINEALAAGADINQTDEAGDPMLMVAIYKRNVPAARHLIERGADRNIRARDGRTPLAATVVWDYHEMTEFRDELLRAGADPNIPDNKGTTPLMRATWHEPTMPLRQLIQFNANLNLRDKQGRTALTRATEDGKLETAEYLRSLGAAE